MCLRQIVLHELNRNSRQIQYRSNLGVLSPNVTVSFIMLNINRRKKKKIIVAKILQLKRNLA